MEKKHKKKLSLKQETILRFNDQELRQVHGGIQCSWLTWCNDWPCVSKRCFPKA